MNITCDHCESEIDVAMDPRCVVYDPSGSTDVICKGCRKRALDRWLLEGEWSPSLSRIKRGFQ